MKTNPYLPSSKQITRKYRSSIAETVHKTVQGFHQTGVVDDRTMRRFDDQCLTPVLDFAPDDIKRLRKRERVSQTVFARYLNVSSTVVSQWERGVKKPGPTAAKLLSLVEKNGLESIA